MDTLAHGLWGGAAFGQRDNQWKWAFLLGMCPDLFSFGPFFLTHIGDIGERWAQHKFGHPDPRLIPAYVYHCYNVTHSLVVWIVLVIITAFLYVWYRRSKNEDRTDMPLHKGFLADLRSSISDLWPLGAWGLHILCDIPTHSTRFFPTPYLWPFPTPFYDGTSWGHKTFMLANYSGIALTYAVLAYRKSKPKA